VTPSPNITAEPKRDDLRSRVPDCDAGGGKRSVEMAPRAVMLETGNLGYDSMLE